MFRLRTQRERERPGLVLQRGLRPGRVPWYTIEGQVQRRPCVQAIDGNHCIMFDCRNASINYRMDHSLQTGLRP